MKRFLRWCFRRVLARVIVLITTEHHYERYLGAVECRGALYIVTTDRIMRYDPERDQFTMKGDID